jgi:hypothetical protein
MAADGKPLVFVLMPFDAAYSSVYTELIQKPLESIGFEVRRADSLLNQQNILKDVVKGIADAALIIADVSGLNENVLYELGLAHGLGKRTVMITQLLEELPFDLRPYRANEYSMMFDQAHKISETLLEIGRAALEGSAEFSNPVQDFAPYALAGEAQVTRTPASAASPARRRGTGDGSDAENAEPGVEAEETPGFIELIVRMERGGERVVAVSDQIGALTEQVGDSFVRHTDRMDKAQKSLGDRSAGALLAIARDAARDLDQFASAMEPLTVELSEALSESAAGADIIARQGSLDTEDEATQARSLIATLIETEETMASTYQQVMSFAESILGLPHMDRRLTRSAKHAGAVVSATAEVVANAQSEFTRIRGLLEERLDG